jgi:Flp pilus assembly pilin Flp
MISISDYLELVKAMARRQEGQTMAEYAVVLGVIVVATVAVFVTLSGTIKTAINAVISAI